MNSSILLVLALFALVIVCCVAAPAGAAVTNPWPRSTPEAEGVSSAKLAELLRFIRDNKTGVQGILLVRNGHLLLEKYYDGYRRDRKHDILSATKSITSALVGIAIDRGLIRDADQYLHELLPEYADRLTPEKKRLTLRHLLTMSSGLEWHDWRTEEIPLSSFDMLDLSEDAVGSILDAPFVTTPGEAFAYNTGSSMLLSAILAHRTGLSPLQFAERHLFRPLGISDYMWAEQSEGVQAGGGGLYLRPVDMAKFGMLYLRKGKWDGRQIISRAWIEESTKRWMDAGEWDYAYHWWRPLGLGTDAYAAAGYKGQYIYVLKDLNTVVVLTGGDVEAGYTMPHYLMQNFIVPSVRSDSALPPDPTSEAEIERLVGQKAKNERTQETALLIIDIQNDYFPEGKMALSGSIDASREAQKVLMYFRTNSLPVVHIRHEWKGGDPQFFAPGSSGAGIHSTVLPMPDEQVFVKHDVSSFEGTSLLEYLSLLEIKKLVVAGMQTNVCVRGTITDAMGKGFQVMLVSDATAAVDAETHRDALADIAARGVKMLTAESLLQGMPDGE